MALRQAYSVGSTHMALNLARMSWKSLMSWSMGRRRSEDWQVRPEEASSGPASTGSKNWAADNTNSSRQPSSKSINCNTTHSSTITNRPSLTCILLIRKNQLNYVLLQVKNDVSMLKIWTNYVQFSVSRENRLCLRFNYCGLYFMLTWSLKGKAV